MRAPRIWNWVGRMGRRSRLEREMAAELRFHIESRAADLERSGVPREEALRRARIEFGSLEAHKEECRASLGLRLWDELRGDVRYALRMLRRSPGFSAAAIATLALGIGANTAVFTILNGVLLRPLPFEQPERLVLVSFVPANWPFKNSYALLDRDYAQLRAALSAFENTAGFTGTSLTLTGAGDPVRLPGAQVTPDFFPVLRVAPAMGRTFLPEDADPGAPPVVVLGDSLWRSRLGADPRIVGTAVRLDGVARTVIGVMPPQLRFPFDAELWVPSRFQPQKTNSMFVRIVGRLKPGMTREQARGQLAAVSRTLPGALGGDRHDWVAAVVPLKELLVGDVRKQLVIFAIAVGFVLLIACTNVANLLLARATRRRMEIAVRAALGARRGRLLRQLLVESAVLSLAGGAAGILLSMWAVNGLLALAPPEAIPRASSVRIDAWVLGYTLALAVVTSVLFGLVPALQATRGELRESLSRAGRTLAARREWLHNALAVVQIALALVLLAATGLMLKSFMRLRAVDPGFRPENAIALTVDLPPASYRTPQRIHQFTAALTEKLAALPGVVSAGAVNWRPMGGALIRGDFHLDDGRRLPDGSMVDKPCVTPGYFRAIGIPLLQGRDFAEADNANAPSVVIISESVARRFWPGQSPLGRRITGEDRPQPSDWLTIVGVVAEIRQEGLQKDAAPAIYQPIAQTTRPMWLSHLSFVARAAGDPLALAPSMRAAVRAVDADLPVQSMAPMTELVAETMNERVFQTRLLAAFAAMALLLAALGVYAVLAYSVAQRTHEIGIRMALGARVGDVVVLVVRQTMVLAGAGIAIGGAGALLITRGLASLLFEVKPGDPATLAGVALLLLAAALGAAGLPARRAAHVDPVVALRHE